MIMTAALILRRYKRLVGVVLFLAILFAVFELSGLRDNFNLEFVRDLILHHQVGGLALFVVLFSLGNLIQIPGWRFLAAAVPAIVSCVLTFVTIRAVGGDALRLLQNRVAVRLLAELDAHPVSSVALLRTLFQTAPALNYALAMSGIDFRRYFLGTLIGLPLPIALYCIFFDVLAGAINLGQ